VTGQLKAHLLDFQHFDLQHLHLHGILRVELLLMHHVGVESGAEGDAVRVHRAGLLLGKAVAGAIDSGHGHAARGEHVGGHFDDLVLFFFVVNAGVVVRSDSGDVESASGGSSVGDVERAGADTACAQAGKERGAVVGVCGRHCTDG